MPAMIEGAGVPLAVEEHGAGRPILLVHDIAADAAAMAGVVAALAPAARVIAYDRRGYGASGAPVPFEATTVNEQAEDAAAVLRALDAAPALVCGAGFGALIALDLLTRHADLVGAAVLADPPLFAFVAEAAEALSTDRRQLEEALRGGGPELAVQRWLGPGADPARVVRAQAAHRAFFADIAGLATWPVTRGTLRAIAAPAVVLTSSAAPAHVVAAADAVAGLIPRAQRRHGDELAAATRLVGGDA
jgi:pimeloyl-ACP methyl ester carboxylesterase